MMITNREIEQSHDYARSSSADPVIKESKSDSKKVSIIHVSPSRNLALAPLVSNRVITVLKTVPKEEIMLKEIKIEPTSPKKPEVYLQRKSMLLEYKELFCALMKLPDRELQKKLLDVINNHRVIEYRTVETQTDQEDFKFVIRKNLPSSSVNERDNSLPSVKIADKNIDKVGKRKKRKRKVSEPQANKESRAKHFAKMNKPKTTGDKEPATDNKFEIVMNPLKRQRFNSFCFSECSSDVVNIYEDTETNILREVEQSCLRLENGLFPIQDAVIRNQTNKLKLHISILRTYKQVNLNDILTEEDEDLLQLAVLNSCDPSIVDLLLRNDLNPNTLDADSNTVIHLAILNDITVESLDQLMKRIDLKLLLTLNDDGYTPLHLAIRQDCYLLAERLINIVDSRLANKVFYKRPVDNLETDEVVLKKQFKDYYENICLKLWSDEEAYIRVSCNHDLKQKLLQTGDRRSGNTALYYAIDNRFEHLIYFLLAHFTDPRTENLSGVDCKTYFNEFGKSLNLSLKVDNIMENIIKLLS